MENCRKNCGNFLEGIEFRPMDVSEYPLLADFLYEAIFLPPGVTPPPREVVELPELQPYIADFGKDGDFCLCAVQGTQVIGAMVQIFAGIRQCGGYAGAGSFPFAVLSRKGHRHSSFREVFGINQTKKPAWDFSFRSERKSCS